MPIDWGATGSMLTGIATLAGAAAVAYAAWVGGNTFDSWKRQKVEERRMDAAERIMTLAYRLKYDFQSVCSPWMSGGEIDKAKADLTSAKADWADSLTEDRQRRMTTAQAYFNRLSHYSDDWQEIWSLKPIALAFFGREVEETLHEFWKHYIEISTSAEAYIEPSGDDEFEKKLRKTLFGHGELPKEIDKSVNKLEAALLPVIRDKR